MWLPLIEGRNFGETKGSISKDTNSIDLFWRRTMQLVYKYILLLILFYFPLEANSSSRIDPDVTSISRNDNGHVTLVEFDTYRYEEKYCKYEVLLLIKNKGKTHNRIFKHYIKQRNGIEYGTSKEGYVSFFSPYETIGNSYGEAMDLLHLYSIKCKKADSENITCIKLTDFTLLSIGGPKIFQQISYCYEFSFKTKKSSRYANLTICANKEKIVSSKYIEIMK